EGAVILVAKRSNRLWEEVRVRHLEEGVAGVRRQAAEQIRPQHRCDHGAISATRLAGDAAVTRLRQRSIPGVDPGNDLIAEIRVVVTRAGRVDILASAQ